MRHSQPPDSSLESLCQSGGQQMLSLVEGLLAGTTESEHLQIYFAQRREQPAACRQDLLPWLVFQAVADSNEASRAIPLAAAWALSLAAAHLMDAAQDNGRVAGVNESIMAIGAGNLALADLAIDETGLREIMTGMAQVMLLGCRAQMNELVDGRTQSRADYFRRIAGKSAALIATGAWLGGRLATADETTLSLLKSFGLALGMAQQIGDDCQDLAEDLAIGVYTLPVLEGCALTEHPHHADLQALLQKRRLSPESVSQVISILQEMGAVTTCRRLMQAYQVQAAAVFTAIPNLALYFADDVPSSS